MKLPLALSVFLHGDLGTDISRNVSWIIQRSGSQDLILASQGIDGWERCSLSESGWRPRSHPFSQSWPCVCNKKSLIDHYESSWDRHVSPWALPAVDPPLFWALQGPPGARSSQPRESRRSQRAPGSHWCHDLPEKTTGTLPLDCQNAPKAPHLPLSE